MNPYRWPTTTDAIHSTQMTYNHCDTSSPGWLNHSNYGWIIVVSTVVLIYQRISRVDENPMCTFGAVLLLISSSDAEKRVWRPNHLNTVVSIDTVLSFSTAVCGHGVLFSWYVNTSCLWGCRFLGDGVEKTHFICSVSRIEQISGSPAGGSFCNDIHSRGLYWKVLFVCYQMITSTM